MWHDPKIAQQHWLPLDHQSYKQHFHMEWRDAVGFTLWLWRDVYESICQSSGNRTELSNWRAIRTASRRRGWKDRWRRGDSCVESQQVTNLLGSKLSNSGWHQNNRQHGLTDTHLILFCCPACALFPVLQPESSSVQRWPPCAGQGHSSFISRPAARPQRHNEL